MNLHLLSTPGDRDIRWVLGNDEPLRGEQGAFGQLLQGLLKVRPPIGGIQKPQVEGPLFVRQQLDRLGIGQQLQGFKWGSVYFKLPPSSLAT